MNLTFNKVGNEYVAEFEATGDFNLHIEKDNGYLSVYQSSVAGDNYDGVKGVRMEDLDRVLDIDFTALVYPKYIRIVAGVEPTVAVVTFTASVEEALQSTIVSNLNTPV